MSLRFMVLVAALTASSACGESPGNSDALDAVVFSKTLGFRHTSIADCVTLLQAHAATEGWDVTATEDSAVLVAALSSSDVIVFCNTSGDVFDPAQEASVEQFIRSGGGFVGIHSAADTEYDWPFYGELVGARFDNHPAIQPARVDIESTNHPASAELPPQLTIEDELYNYQSNPRGQVTVLATLDESSYTGGDMGDDHPIMWYREIGAGRAFYVGLGHREETYARADFREIIRGAMTWAAGL